MRIQNASSKKALKSRLCRVAGQLKGVADMIDRDAECADIAVQLSACRNAIQQALGAFTTCAIEETRGKTSHNKKTEDINKLLKLVM